MSTENLPKKPTTTSHLKKLNTGRMPPPAAAPSENIVEQVPAWLKQLLTKYGEREGRLVGLGEGYSAPTAEASEAEAEDEAGLSALLAQMAEEGVPSTGPARSSTSVEWGGYRAEPGPEPPAMDDLLSALGAEAPAAQPAPDWLTDMQPETYRPEPDFPQAGAAAPEWLNDIIQQEEDMPAPLQSAPESQDVPDWLIGALDTPAAPATPPPPAAPPQTREQDFDVPDWLNDALNVPGSSAGHTPTPPPTPALDIPDWLVEKSVEPPAPQSPHPPTSPAPDDYQAAIEVPDWLESIASPSPKQPATPDRDESESTIEVPDWLANIAPPSTGQTGPGSPSDWASQADAGQELPSLDWLFQGEDAELEPAPTGQAAPAQSDWLFNLPNELPSDALADSTGMPDWLAELPGAESGTGELPDWLKETPLPSPESTSDDWLAELNLSADQPGASSSSLAALDFADDDLSPWSDKAETAPTPVPPPAEAKPASRYKRLKPLEPGGPPDRPAEGAPAGVETDQDATPLPEWAARLAAPDAPTETETTPPPQWAQGLVPADLAAVEPPAAASPQAVQPPTPVEAEVDDSLEWLSPAPEPAGTSAAEPSDWLSAFASDADLSPDWSADAAETGPGDWLAPEREAEEADLLAQRLDWFTQGSSEQAAEPSEMPAPTLEPPAASTPAEPQLDDLGWLRDLPSPAGLAEPASPSAEAAAAQTEAEVPPWLADITGETPGATPEAEEIAYPAWLTESAVESPGEPAAQADEETNIPSWLMGLSTSEAETSTWLEQADETMAAQETPGWLASPAPEPDSELPVWLAELGSETSTAPAWSPGPEPTPPVEPEASTENLDWLTEVAAPPLETPAAETDVPAWLSSLAAVPAEADIEAEAGAPAWLSAAPEAPAAETFAAAPDEAEPLEIPDWLTALSTDVSPPQEAETEAETPPWLTELTAGTEPETGPVGAGEPLAWLTKDTAGPEAEADLDTPAWLAELTPAEVAPSTLTGSAEAEAEVPSWLDELRETTSGRTPEEPGEAPSWLNELPEVSALESAAEAETPSWLAELPAESEALAQAAPTSTAEADIPSWLLELSGPPAAAAAPEPEAEAPSWLSELPPVEEETPPWLAELAEAAAPAPQAEETPDWLAELDDTSLEAEAEAPAWPAGSIEATPAPASEPPAAEPVPQEVELELETPDWLAAVSQPPAVETTQAEPATPTWFTQPAETSAAITPSPDEEELETPTWLWDLPPEKRELLETDLPETAAEVETFLWQPEPLLNDRLTPLPETPPAALPAAPAWPEDLSIAPSAAKAPAAEPEEELVIPDWLGKASAEAQAEATSEPETPDWLTELVETAPPEIAPPPPAVEPDVPAWLSELPQAPALEEQAPPEELAGPAWLAELEEPAAVEAAPEAEVTPDMPAWLTDLRAAQAAALETEAEAPAWLADQAESAALEIAPAAEPEPGQEMPAWLAELSAEPAAAAPAAEPAEELVMPSWLTQSLETPEAEPVEAAAEPEEELVIPAWLGKTAAAMPPETPAGAETPLPELAQTPPVQAEEPAIPAWLAELPEAATTEAETGAASETPAWLADLATEAETTPTPVEAIEPAQAEETPASPAWLPGLDGAPQWPREDRPEAEAIADNFLAFEEEPEAPDWLKDEPVSPLPSAAPGRPKTGPLQLPGEAKPASSVERMSEWLRNLQPVETPVESPEVEPTETTGMLTGLAPLLPAEKIGPVTPSLSPPATAATAESDAVLEAAQHFYTIATQPPQPAALPELPARREGLIRCWLRALFHLVFVALVALPLIPGLQKTVSGQNVPWTEPAGELSAVLDRQRRELTSAQLGVIDLQQPGSVALVSWDFSPATQGEMEPLAEAVISRLRGQGMRLIFVSLEPEGAALAQRSLERILAERNETYGVDMVNLGYVPGQVAGIRELVSGRRSLATLADFKEGLTFGAAGRANWNTINNLGQVNVVITLADNPATARWWIEQMAAAPPPAAGERYLLAATSALADPLVRPYLDSGQLNGLLSGLNGAAAIEAGRKNFGPARRMLDSQSVAHLAMVILIAVGTMAGWMPDQKDQV